MSRAGDYGRGGGRGGERWDSERFAVERDRARFEERDSRFSRGDDFPPPRARERSVDEIYERRGPRGFEEDRYERREYYDDEREYSRPAPGRDRNFSLTIEKERERDFETSPPPPRRGGNRPAFMRRQSSLDTFDRKPLTRFVDREEYGPPARYRPERDRPEVRPAPLIPIPLPRTKALPPPRRYAEREYYDEIEIAEPDHYGDERFRGYPERVREREIIRKKKRSKSRESRASHSVASSVRSSSTSSSSSSSDESVVTVKTAKSGKSAKSSKSEFPKKGKTRMPARLVSKQAIIDLGYPFEEEGETIIIQKALGRENIDEVIKLSEEYKVEKVEMRGGRSEAGTIVEERHEVFTIPPPPPSVHHAPPPPPTIIHAPPPPPSVMHAPPPPPAPVQYFEETKVVEHFREPSPHHSHHGGPIIMDARPQEEVYERREYYEREPAGALVTVPHRGKDERAIRAEIKALEAEKEALRAEKRAEKEMRKADRIRRGGRASEGDLVLYERDRFETADEELIVTRRERIEEPSEGVRIEKDKKGRMAISVPKYYR